MKKVIVSGGNGNFAKSLRDIKTEKYHFVFLEKEKLNVQDFENVQRVLDIENPDIFLHSGALTRPMSKHIVDPEASIRTNILGTTNVVLACMQKNIKVVYISTDFVYPGISGGYKETDPVLPVNEYAWSKLGGECSVRLYRNSLILRMAMVEYPFPHSKALVDVRKSSIFQPDAARICVDLLEEFGTINVGGDPQTIYDFASKTNDKIEKMTREEVSDVRVPIDTTMDIHLMKKTLLKKDR